MTNQERLDLINGANDFQRSAEKIEQSLQRATASVDKLGQSIRNQVEQFIPKRTVIDDIADRMMEIGWPQPRRSYNKELQCIAICWGVDPQAIMAGFYKETTNLAVGWSGDPEPASHVTSIKEAVEWLAATRNADPARIKPHVGPNWRIG